MYTVMRIESQLNRIPDAINTSRMETPSYKLSGLAVAFLLLAPHPFAFAQEATLLLQIKSFSVGPDQIPSYPSSRIPGLPDEHTTFMPPSSSTAPYLVFGASNLGPGTTGGAVVLETTDFVNFSLASSLGYTTQVMTPPIPINQCNPAYTTEFDGNYAAPDPSCRIPASRRQLHHDLRGRKSLSRRRREFQLLRHHRIRSLRRQRQNLARTD